MKELRSEYFEYLRRYLNIECSLSNSRWHTKIVEAIAGVYFEKTSRRQKVSDVGFAWHPDTLFQPNDISIGTCSSSRKHL